MPGLGWLGGYCIKVSGTRFLSTEMWITKWFLNFDLDNFVFFSTGVFASHCLNILLSLNRFTSLTLSRAKNRRVWISIVDLWSLFFLVLAIRDCLFDVSHRCDLSTHSHRDSAGNDVVIFAFVPDQSNFRTYQPVTLAANFTVYYITSSYDFVVRPTESVMKLHAWKSMTMAGETKELGKQHLW